MSAHLVPSVSMYKSHVLYNIVVLDPGLLNTFFSISFLRLADASFCKSKSEIYSSYSFAQISTMYCNRIHTFVMIGLQSGRAKGLRSLSLFVGCLTSQQHASVSQGWICSDNKTCYHTEIEVADQTFHLTHSQYTDTGPTSPALTLQCQAPGRAATLECQFLSHWYDSTPKKSQHKRDSNPGSSALKAATLTTRPTRR